MKFTFTVSIRKTTAVAVVFLIVDQDNVAFGIYYVEHK